MTKSQSQATADTNTNEEPVTVTFEDGIAWVTLNRPAKRNCINPAIVYRMCDILNDLESDDRCKVLVLTGAGDAFSAGMDLREYFRATDDKPAERLKLFRANGQWQWRQLRHYAKPTIAMVNGWCFGGAFTPVIACDLAIAADDATFGLSEINWGIIPAGVVNRAVSQLMRERDGMYYVMTGETFSGKRAAEIGLVNESVPLEDLRARTTQLAKVLMEKNPAVLRTAKVSYRIASEMTWEQGADYLMAKHAQSVIEDPENGRNVGMSQFLDDKTYRPGLGSYKRDVK
ncbi:p-hydroxycinnamoyl CoA hydratase/lyase [Noviherbaspirillum saxi]|uniref:p-hydroxycinnamoyl CoA hydratase/lyase n=1 Tax=Noviherbaspirillum saxi TaxID=2320863 RepID=A0A3A3FIA6_9BURK|nr:p-hydroxycinnamoyl CoA hydratase/lyase [Noviherbaspirillum saxi]RJF92264.1 p-hydroxycinnamoyl CoA hydratase/lyase [Noviherbaspirillum saxi]